MRPHLSETDRAKSLCSGFIESVFCLFLEKGFWGGGNSSMVRNQACQPLLTDENQITTGFETQWKTGLRPRVSEFAAQAPALARRSVLLKLIKLDVDYRRRAGENPSVDDYRNEYSEINPEELNKAVTGSQAGDLTPTAATEGDVAITFDASASSSPVRFKKIEEIGRGGMGSVWRAIQMSTGREVALKELPAGALESTAARSRFEEEIQWASLLQHPHIARVYDSGLLEGSYVYAMELIQGEHLDEYARRNHWTLRQMLEMMASIAKAMHYAHTRNVLHLDLKPSNIMITPEGKPIILDFGLARLVRNTPGDKGPRYGHVIGTPAYMAPEQAQGREDLIGYPTDVYSLGVIIYHFVTGEFPRAHKNSDNSLPPGRLEQKKPRARELNPRIGDNLDALIEKSLAPNPADRYADAGQLASDIECLLQGTELKALPLNWIGKLKSWCCHPTRLLQAGNLAIAIGAILVPFHIIGIVLGITEHFGMRIHGIGIVRLNEFLPIMAGFLSFDAWLIYSGFRTRRDRVWALWINMALVTGWLCWFALVLSGIMKFDTGGAVPNMDVRLPIYIIFMGFAVVGFAIEGLAISAHYARVFLNDPLPSDRALQRIGQAPRS
jgi:hypothetical protein